MTNETNGDGIEKSAVDIALALLADQKAVDVRVYEAPQSGILVDRVIVATGEAGRHIEAMADSLRRRFKGAGRCSIEGNGSSGWVLVDAGEIVVHLFMPDRRGFYDLDSLWRRVA